MIKDKTPSNQSSNSIKSRMLWHVALTFIILTLLFFISLLSYNEIINEKKLVGFFNDLNKTEILLSHLDSTNLNYIKGQEALLNYLVSNNDEDIQDYFSSVHLVKNMIDSVQFQVSDLEVPIIRVDTLAYGLDQNQNLSQMIDSLSQNMMRNLSDNVSSTSYFKKIDYDDLNVKTTIITKSSIDSVKKKKIIGRLGDAVKGKVDIQKEKQEMLMILEYGGEKSSGSVEKQMSNIVKMTTVYYEKELRKVNRKFDQLTSKNKNVLLNAMRIQNMSNDVLNHYKKSLIEQRSILSEKYAVQYNNNRMIRLYTLFGLATLLILLTFAVLYLTNSTYKIEKKLITAKEKLTDNLMLKNKIVSMISHDIRSPLNIILLYLKQALKLEKDPQKTAVFDSINYTTNSAFLLANRILDFSKDENNQMTVYKDEFNLYDEINHIVNGFNTLAQSKNNKLININELEPSVEVVFDRSKLQRLYYNILDNAIKHTESGDIEVLSEWEQENNESYKFTISIKDTGKGISEENLKKIFEPFQQVSSTMLNDQDLGVGLGLYLCKEITELFDGNILVQSQLGEGTTITAFVYMEKK